MFCFQCQEAANCTGCTKRGVCGKSGEVSNLQDGLVHILKRISVKLAGKSVSAEQGSYIADALFATLTNTNFDESRISSYIRRGCVMAAELGETDISDPILFTGKSISGGFSEVPENLEDVRSLRELITFGVKGMAAYYHHALVLGKRDEVIENFMVEALAATLTEEAADKLVAMIMKTGEIAVRALAHLDEANTSKYGHPEITSIPISVSDRPAILVSGHDLNDLEQLLVQTGGMGIDIYTHGEMLPAHTYPFFKQFDHLKGNYGGAWYTQAGEFEKFNGPILMTTNCIVPPRESYKSRLFTTGTAGYEGCRHIEIDENGQKDFSEIIEIAKNSASPEKLEEGEIVAGFARNQVMAVADKVVDAVKAGKIKRFVVMAGCDGRHKERSYYTDLAENLPEDTVILTAGCAKYRYNKLNLGDIDGIPRVLDAGQCNDSYSLAYIALKLKEVFELEDINELPISYDIAWYEQKAVTVLLALLYLGVKGIRLGPTLPAFLSPGVAKVLVETFDIKGIGSVEEDLAAIAEGK